jgi:hypothetical protein
MSQEKISIFNASGNLSNVKLSQERERRQDNRASTESKNTRAERRSKEALKVIEKTESEETD